MLMTTALAFPTPRAHTKRHKPTAELFVSGDEIAMRGEGLFFAGSFVLGRTRCRSALNCAHVCRMPDPIAYLCGVPGEALGCKGSQRHFLALEGAEFLGCRSSPGCFAKGVQEETLRRRWHVETIGGTAMRVEVEKRASPLADPAAGAGRRMRAFPLRAHQARSSVHPGRTRTCRDEHAAERVQARTTENQRKSTSVLP